jgi:hypothetical protein
MWAQQRPFHGSGSLVTFTGPVHSFVQLQVPDMLLQRQCWPLSNRPTPSSPLPLWFLWFLWFLLCLDSQAKQS